MKRQLIFKYVDNQYQLVEENETLFVISSDDLRFDSLKFYQGVFCGDNKSTYIELVDETLASATNQYVYKWLKKIIEEISKSFPEDIEEDADDVKHENIKEIELYDLALCAGIGDYVTDQNITNSHINTSNSAADYAVTISGKSMEPTYKDHDVVLVKKTQTPKNKDVCVVCVDGKMMCKRFIDGENKRFVSDNSEYGEVILAEEQKCEVQGVVIEKFEQLID